MLEVDRKDLKLFRNRSVIYALVCPLSNQIRYIGKSISGMDRAFEHLRVSSRKEGNTRKNNWLNKIIGLGLQPIVVMLDSFSNISNDELYKIEHEYIEFYKPSGYLTNLTDGGPGMTGHKYSELSRQKMSESAKKRPIPTALLLNQFKKLPPDTTTERYCSKCLIFLSLTKFRKNSHYCKKHHKKVSRVVPGKKQKFNDSRKHRIVARNIISGIEIGFLGYKNACEFLGGKANKTGIRLAVKSGASYYNHTWSVICQR